MCNMKICPKCHKVLTDDAIVCKHCHANLRQPAPATSSWSLTLSIAGLCMVLFSPLVGWAALPFMGIGATLAIVSIVRAVAEKRDAPIWIAIVTLGICLLAVIPAIIAIFA